MGKDVDYDKGVKNRIVIKGDLSEVDKEKAGNREVKKNFADLVLMEKGKNCADFSRTGGVERSGGLEDSVAQKDVDWLISWAENLEDEALSVSKEAR